MSAFGNYLTLQMERRQRTAREFAGDLGISPAMLSRLITDEHQTCRRQTLTRICTGISDDPIVQAEAQAAYLRDQRVEPGRDKILIMLGAGASFNETPPDAGLDALARESSLDRKTINALRRVIEGCVRSRRLKRIVQDWGDLAQHEL